MPDYAISEVTRRSKLRDFLLRDPGLSAYALGDLEEPHFSQTQWWAASRTGEIEGIALVYLGIQPPAMFLAGDRSALSALLLFNPGPDHVTYLAPPELEATLHDLYQVNHQDYMLRMRITKGTFFPLEVPPDRLDKVIPLSSAYATAVIDLLSEAADADGRQELIAFDASMMDDGFYFGVLHGDGVLAVAGTHLTSRSKSVAAIGNIVVHPRARRQGLGALVTAKLTQAILEASFELVVLNVRRDNGPAIKIYRRLGYRVVGEFIEGLGQRRSTLPQFTV